jgi:hypothetical protein
MIGSIRRENGTFSKGARCSVATEIRPGQRLSPKTEFKAGQSAPNKLPVGSVTIRNRLGTKRAFVKIAEPNVWRERAKVVWERENSKRLPRGYVVHHIDRDALNDAPNNLVALTRAEHAREHLAEVQASGFGGEIARMNARRARRRS